MFRFFGILMGFAVRSEQTFNIDLHPSIWKKIVGQPIDYETDLETLDVIALKQLKYLRKQANDKELTDEEF